MEFASKASQTNIAQLGTDGKGWRCGTIQSEEGYDRLWRTKPNGVGFPVPEHVLAPVTNYAAGTNLTGAASGSNQVIGY